MLEYYYCDECGSKSEEDHILWQKTKEFSKLHPKHDPLIIFSNKKWTLHMTENTYESRQGLYLAGFAWNKNSKTWWKTYDTEDNLMNEPYNIENIN